MHVPVPRLLGAALILLVLAAGVVVGRVIEAITVAAVLIAVGTSVRRLLATPAEGTTGQDHPW